MLLFVICAKICFFLLQVCNKYTKSENKARGNKNWEIKEKLQQVFKTWWKSMKGHATYLKIVNISKKLNLFIGIKRCSKVWKRIKIMGPRKKKKYIYILYQTLITGVLFSFCCNNSYS